MGNNCSIFTVHRHTGVGHANAKRKARSAARHVHHLILTFAQVEQVARIYTPCMECSHEQQGRERAMERIAFDKNDAWVLYNWAAMRVMQATAVK